MTAAVASAPHARAFISYARSDLAFADRLVEALNRRGVATSIDRRDLPLAEKWQNELLGLIQKSDAVVFLVSKASIGSKWCQWEIDRVAELKKRLAPVVLERVDMDKLPSRLSEINFQFFDDPDAFESQVNRLVAALDTDISWVKEHTRVSERARSWVGVGRPPNSYLLDGAELVEVETWLTSRPSSAPEVTEEQIAYVQASRAAQAAALAIERQQIARTRRFQRALAWTLGGLFLIGAVGAILIVIQSRIAEEKRMLALAQRAKEANDQKNFERAMRYAVAGMPSPGALPWNKPRRGLDEVTSQLRFAATSTRLLWKVGTSSSQFRSGAIASLADKLLAERQDGQFEVWDTNTTLRLATFKPASQEDPDTPVRLSFAGDPSHQMVVSLNTRPPQIWDPTTGTATEAGPEIEDLQFQLLSPDGRLVVAINKHGSLELRETVSWKRRATLPFSSDLVAVQSISPDGNQLLLLPQKNDGTLILFNVRSNRQISWKAHEKEITDAKFSPDGRWILTESSNIFMRTHGDGTVRLWPAAVRDTSKPAASISGSFDILKFVSNGRYLVGTKTVFLDFLGQENDLYVHSVPDGKELAHLSGRTGKISRLAVAKNIQSFPVDNNTPSEIVTLATSGADGTVAVWELMFAYPKQHDVFSGLVMKNVTEFVGSGNNVDLEFDNDGSRLIAVSADSLRVWQLPGRGSGNPPFAGSFSPAKYSGKNLIISRLDPSKLLIDSESGETRLSIPASTEESDVVASPDGFWAMVRTKSNISLWSLRSGKPVAQQLTTKTSQEEAAGDRRPMRFSSDGSTAVYVDDAGKVRGWSLRTAGQVPSAIEPFGESGSLRTELNPDTAQFVFDGHIVFWDVVRQTRIVDLSIKGDSCGSATWLGKMAALLCVETADHMHRLELWNLQSGQKLKSFDEYESVSSEIKTSDDGTFAAADGVGFIEIIDLAATEEKRITRPKDATIEAFAKNSRHLLLRTDAKPNETTHQLVWDIPSNRLIADVAPGFWTANLSPEERRIFEAYSDDNMLVRDIGDALSADGPDLRSYVCNHKMRGNELFTDVELQDPILAGESRNPCKPRYGPLDLGFYSSWLGIAP